MINFEIALMRGFLGGRQGLCDYEGHLIVRSFHGEGEGLHNYTHYTDVVVGVGHRQVLRAEQGKHTQTYQYI